MGSRRSLLCFLLVSVSSSVAYNAAYVLLSSNASTLERRFGFNSGDSGALMVANDIGFASTVLLVSYHGNRLHRPRVLALGAVATGLATAAYALPYFVYGPKLTGAQLAAALRLGRNATDASGAGGHSRLLCYDRDASAETGPRDDEASASAASDAASAAGAVAFWIFMLAGILQGAASTPAWSVLFTLVEDSAAPARSPLYLGGVIAARTLSPLAGFCIVAQLLATHESFDSAGLQESDTSEWIGNWWAGSLGLGAAIASLGLPLLLFPRQLPDSLCCSCGRDSGNAEAPAATTTPAMSTAPEASGFLRSLRRTGTDPAVILVLVSCVLGLATSGMEMYFIVKYFEDYFNVLPSEAGQLVGVTCALPTALATFAGGLLVSRLRLSVVGMTKFIGAIFLVTTLLSLPNLFFACPSEPFDPRLHMGNSSCQAACNCDEALTQLRPVCGSDSLHYLTPCHAGCTAAAAAAPGHQPEASLFLDCRCLAETGGDNLTTALAGACHGRCGFLYPFAVLKFASHFFDGLTMVPWFLLVMRICKSKEDAAMGVGLISMFFCLAASVSGHAFGRVYDSACLFLAGSGRSNCLLYDKRRLLLMFNGLPLLFRLPYAVLLLAAFVCIRRRFRQGEAATKSEGARPSDDEAEAAGQLLQTAQQLPA